ncbi:MAG: SH3 domain-containing protein [Vicinamibacterales bacterium]
MRNTARFVAALVVVIVVAARADAQVVMVTSDRVNLRVEPSTSSRVVMTLSKGALVEVLSEEGEWYRVKTLASDVEGYLHRSIVSAPPATPKRRPSPPAKTPPPGQQPARPQAPQPQPPPGAEPAAPAGKPAPTGRAMAWVNGGWQATKTSFSDAATFDLHAETASSRAEYEVPAGPAVDVGVAVRLWRNLYAASGVTRFWVTEPAAVSARLPHPFEFNRFREVKGDSQGLERAETAVHAMAMVVVPAGRKFLVSVFAGPTWFNVTQDLVTEVQFHEEYPFDEATFTGTAITNQSRSKAGFSAGADVTYLLAPKFGVGGSVRYSQAKLDFSVDSRTLSVEAGGLQVGLGVRVRF